jgi:hypothetical protein
LGSSGSISVQHNIQSHVYTLLTPSKTNSLLSSCHNLINLQIEERNFHGSDLSLDQLLYLDLHIYRVKNFRGSSFQRLPFITKAVINVQNNDNKCFLWSILATKFPPKSNFSHIFSYKQYEYKYDIDEFPVHVNDIKKIERKINLAINVFGIEGEGNSIENYTLEPLYISENEERNREMSQASIDE